MKAPRSKESFSPLRDVVVGGGRGGGLRAAAAAAGSGRQVTIVERDRIPATMAPRPGVPQGQQPHVFLYRGLLAMEELLPGLRQDLLDRGAVPVNTGDLPWYSDLGWTELGHEGFEIVSATRPLFEHVVTSRVRALPAVRMLEGVKVRGLSRDGDRWALHLQDGGRLSGELVIDASGRSSRMPEWLAELGIEVPPPTKIDAKVGYATRMYAAAPEDGGFPGVVVMSTPATRSGGMALRVEDDRFLVLASGYGERRPPRDAAGFLEHLRGLADPAVADLVAAREPLGDVLVYRQTGNRRQHYDNISSWPRGLLVMGDALCAFNPVYGQGITVAAIEAGLLRRELRRGFSGSARDCRRVMRRFCSATDLPWAIATGADAAYVTALGAPRRSPAQWALGWWTTRVGWLATHGNQRAAHTLARVYHLIGSPAGLLHPALLAAVVKARVAGAGPPAPRPAHCRVLRAPPNAEGTAEC